MNRAKKNNQSGRSVPGKNLGYVGIRHAFGDCFLCALPDGLNYGACGMVAGSPNRVSSSDVVPWTAMSRSISIGLRALCMVVRMMVMASATFILPRVVMFPKISFRSRTAFRMACSAKLFVGSMIGYLRKVKSSFFKGDQPLADVVGFVVRQRRVPVQFTKSFEDIFSAGTVCFNGQNGVLTMQGNRILNQFFHREQEAFGIRMFLQSGVEKFLDITKEMYQTFLFGECSDLVPVSVPEVGNQDAMVKCAQMINDNLGAPALVDVEKGNERIGENPEPVAFPPGFVGMHESVVRQGLFKSIVKRLAPLGHVLVKADQGGVRKLQVAETFQRAPGIVVGAFDLMAHERGLGSNIRADESVGYFVFAPTVYDMLAVGTPVVAVDKACGGKFAVLKVFLNMFGGMVAGRNSFAAADRTAVKINVERFVDHFRIGAGMPLMSDRSSTFCGTFRRIFLLIFGKRGLKCVGQFFLEMLRFLFKFFDVFLKLLELMIGEIHGELKRIDPVAKILAFRQNALRFLAVKEYAEFAKGAIWTFCPASVRILWLRPTHVAFPMVNRFSECFLCTI